jgi:hypothetical protein
MVFEAFTMVFITGTLVWETKTVVSKPETILLAAGTMVFLIKKIFWLARTMVAVIGTTVCVKNTIFPMSETTVTAAKKMVSVVPTKVCKVLSIGVLIVEQSFANPKLVVFRELQPARIIITSGNSTSDPTDQVQLHPICALKFLSSFFFIFPNKFGDRRLFRQFREGYLVILSLARRDSITRYSIFLLRRKPSCDRARPRAQNLWQSLELDN